MAENAQLDSQPSMAALVGGIVNDAQQLVRQELALARSEIQNEWSKAKTAGLSLAAGAGVAVLGGILLCLMLVHLIHRLAGATDPAAVPLWGCYAIVGGLLAAGGATMIVVGRNKASEVNFVPRQTVETLKENVQWIKNQT